MRKLVSVIVPVYNEQAGINDFLDKELEPALEKLAEETEIILVDDGSRDESLKLIRAWGTEQKQKVRIIALVKNFGKEIALTAGIREARGDAVITLDADGQHPAEEIPRMVEKWHKGARIVTAVRAQNTTSHRLGSWLYYRLMRRLGNQSVHEGETDFRLMDRVVVEEFNRFTEHNRMTRGLVNWLGFPQEHIKIQTKNRKKGAPTYSLRKLMTLAGDSLVSASRTPLLIFGYIGVGIMLVSGAVGLFQLVQEYILGDPLGIEWGGGVAVSLFVAFLVGLVLISQAMTALYVSQIHAEVKNRPLYIIDREKSVGLDDGKK
ncbi:glycosyltransferase family 2 protein [Candidatus Saccharibacteria bacterium]|nr:glycosyltransferase family 2 protein [Candidatus Saccharibacteria bacterium]